MRTVKEALARSYAKCYENKDESCALCGAPGEVLFHYHGGWWCRKHESIPMREFEKDQEPLTETIRKFVEFHS